MVEEKLADEKKRLKQMEQDLLNQVKKGADTPMRSVGTGKKVANRSPGGVVKSPSDTTLYKPAFRLNRINTANGNEVNNISINGYGDQIVQDQINDFVEAVRAENEKTDPQPSTSRRDDPDYKEARKRADRMILDTEKFKATMMEPVAGNNPIIISKEYGKGVGLSDDDFFHLTCHMDQSLLEKIE